MASTRRSDFRRPRVIMPFLSVTAIGLGVGLVAGLVGSEPGVRLARSVVGAWVGFGAGALVGVVLDVVGRTGTGVALWGHAGALVGAVAGSSVVTAFRQARSRASL
jgi:hypothetical protein